MTNPTDPTVPLDTAAADYARAVEARRALQAAVRRAVLAVTDQYAPDLRAAVAAETDAHATLLALVEQSPALFERPKSRTVAGVRFGWREGRASIHVEDEAATIARIRRLLPAEQADLLIRTKEALHKPSVLDLTAADLRRLKIEQVPAAPAPFAKPVADATDRLVDLLVDEAQGAAEEAA